MHAYLKIVDIPDTNSVRYLSLLLCSSMLYFTSIYAYGDTNQKPSVATQSFLNSHYGMFDPKNMEWTGDSDLPGETRSNGREVVLDWAVDADYNPASLVNHRICTQQSLHIKNTIVNMIAICNSDPDRQGSSLWGTSDFFALEEDSGKMQVLASLTNVPSGNHGQPNPVSVIQIGKDIYGFTQEGIDGYHERQDTTYKKHIYALINQEIVPSLTIETRTVSCIDEDGICYFKERNFIIDVSRLANNTYPAKITGEMWKEGTDDNSRNISRKNIHLLKVCHLTFDIKDGKYKYLENINDPEKGCHK